MGLLRKMREGNDDIKEDRGILVDKKENFELGIYKNNELDGYDVNSFHRNLSILITVKAINIFKQDEATVIQMLISMSRRSIYDMLLLKENYFNTEFYFSVSSNLFY
jgi:hypothetical protein